MGGGGGRSGGWWVAGRLTVVEDGAWHLHCGRIKGVRTTNEQNAVLISHGTS